MTRGAIHVIATTISGSISDRRKVERIVPLFRDHGREDVTVHTVDSHSAAQGRAREIAAAGARTLISAGGSGTFNSVLEGCIRSGVPLAEISLGFLRKGSADLLGKSLGMPDAVEPAVKIFADALREGRTLPCDVIRAESQEAGTSRHFVGYGGAGIFGRIPHYTENRFVKHYKGILGQLFGDLGPFRVGAALAAGEAVLRRLAQGPPRPWKIAADGAAVEERLHAIVLVNGDLGRDLPWARGAPLGSGRFHMFTFRDLGLLRMPGQLREAYRPGILESPARWGFDSREIARELVLAPAAGGAFPVNTDGFTLSCRGAASFRIVERINLIAGPA